MASQQPTYMKAKLATGMIFILLFQIALFLPEVEQLDDFQTENRSQINSPQGVAGAMFMAVESPSFDYYYSGTEGSRSFGSDLIAVADNYQSTDQSPSFGGNSFCNVPAGYGGCDDDLLLILNYSSNSLEGYIGGLDGSESFDTDDNSLHLASTAPIWVEWPLNSAPRNYSSGKMIFDPSGNVISNKSMAFTFDGSNSGLSAWPGYYYNEKAGSALQYNDTKSQVTCSIESLVALSNSSSILEQFCSFQSGSYRYLNSGNQWVYSAPTKHFNFTNSSNLQNLSISAKSGHPDLYKIILTQKITNQTIDWTNPKLLLNDNQGTTCVPGTHQGIDNRFQYDGHHATSANHEYYVATFSGPIAGCKFIGTVDGNNITQFYSTDRTQQYLQFNAVLTYAINSTTGENIWSQYLGIPSYYKKIVVNENSVTFCTSVAATSWVSGFFVNSSTLNVGVLGFIKVNASTGAYESHTAIAGSGISTGCGNLYSEQNEIYGTAQRISYSNGNFALSNNHLSVIRLDSQNNIYNIYTIQTGNSGIAGIFESPNQNSALFVINPNNVNFGSGSLAGGTGIGVLFFEDDYDQDNQADNVDSDDDNDGYLDVNDNCPRGMMGWTPGASTDADSDGCHFSEDLDNDNDGIEDSLDDCDSPANSFTSTPITDYDGDGCRDSTEDDDDDNDNILDVNDNCIKSVNNSDVLTNDTDSDGCGDSVEDYDDDNDGVFDVNDQCQTYPNTWQSSSNTDHDSDGCKDSIEDDDDDNDGINDNLDSCSTGKIGWIPTTENDGDSDGCYDANEDIDDDNDGVTDSADACPKQAGDSSFGSLLGCPDTDQDGYGDNIDSCESEYGTSFRDVYGCPDTDGDGYSDSGDDFPDDATAHSDSDSDGVEDSIDEFPFLPGQWLDGDGDGYGDNPTGPTPDSCVETYGNSTRDIYGCLDSDGDGYSDINDKFPNDKSKWLDTDNDGVEDSDDAFPLDPSQQTDSDGDGAGDNPTGVGADKFPNDSTQWSDIDGDSYGDNPNGTNPDAFITDSTQWSDADGDGYGDNPSGRLYDQFPINPTQWEDADGDGLGDNQNGTEADPYLNDFDNDGYNDSIDILPKLPSPGDLDADGCLDGDDAFPSNSQECLDNDGDGEGDNADVDDDNDGWADTDEIRLNTDPFNSAEEPVESFEIVIPGTSVGLGAWDLIGMFGGIPLFVWIGFGFVTRNTRCAKYEAMLREANTRDELESVAYKWEYSLMLRMLGPHQGIRLERLRAELDDKFEAMAQPLSSIDNHEFDQTQMVVEEMNDTEKQVPELVTQSDYPSIEDTAQKTDENGYEWFTAQDGTNFYRTIGSQADWVKLEN